MSYFYQAREISIRHITDDIDEFLTDGIAKIFLAFVAEDFEEMSERERRAKLSQFIKLDDLTGLESCVICQKTYAAKFPSVRLRSLLNHIERVHIKQKNYACDFCDHRFHSKAQKASHITVKHREEQHRLKNIMNIGVPSVAVPNVGAANVGSPNVSAANVVVPNILVKRE